MKGLQIGGDASVILRRENCWYRYMSDLIQQEEIFEDQNLPTLNSFIGTLEKERAANPCIEKAFGFGKMAIVMAGQMEERIDLREPIHHLIESSLLFATDVYRVHLLVAKHSVDTEDQETILEEAKKEISYCHKLLEQLDAMVEDFDLIKKMKDEAEGLAKIVRKMVKTKKGGTTC